MKTLAYFFITMIVFCLCLNAQANVTYSFECITNNNLANANIGKAQLFVNVSDPDSSQVLFTFTNTGSESSSITQIYFDHDDVDPLLLAIASIDNSCSGVLFIIPTKIGNLPGGNSLTPKFDEDFSAEPDTPVQPNGVNPGEWLSITFSLQNGKSYDNVISNLASGDLRVGIHVQAFPDGKSESFVNDGIIPAPGAILLGGIGVVLIGWLRYRRTL